MSELSDLVRHDSRRLSRESLSAVRGALEQRARRFANELPEFVALPPPDQVKKKVALRAGDFNEALNARIMPSPKTDGPLGRELEAAGQLQAVGNLPQRSQLEGAGKKKTSRKLRLYIYSQDPCCNMVI